MMVCSNERLYVKRLPIQLLQYDLALLLKFEHGLKGAEHRWVVSLGLSMNSLSNLQPGHRESVRKLLSRLLCPVKQVC
ncbi:hypothetical protein ADK75_10710 [Streptomyces virginiae]|uniref:Uncharacterized protein n=1 Tax=Streptomyces virginiae TaxID=1961 RepID=A0A0L8MYT3_STRVG|nr:hypothetical protein ADK75_10710 [Streptomyces virginiae]